MAKKKRVRARQRHILELLTQEEFSLESDPYLEKFLSPPADVEGLRLLRALCKHLDALGRDARRLVATIARHLECPSELVVEHLSAFARASQQSSGFDNVFLLAVERHPHGGRAILRQLTGLEPDALRVQLHRARKSTARATTSRRTQR